MKFTVDANTKKAAQALIKASTTTSAQQAGENYFQPGDEVIVTIEKVPKSNISAESGLRPAPVAKTPINPVI
jgi:hypothetical protein